MVALLQRAPGVQDVRWPGFSGMVSFRHPEATAIAARTRLFTLAESLGGVESLIEVPQAMTHQSVEGSAAAVPPDLVRLSCGIEAPEDLVADLRQALSQLTSPAGGDATAAHRRNAAGHTPPIRALVECTRTAPAAGLHMWQKHTRAASGVCI